MGLYAITLFLVLGLQLLPAISRATEHTVVLQQGTGGYEGVRDTWVSSNDWASPPQYRLNYGQHPLLTLGRSGDDNPLLRFDLGTIPANSQVLSARLHLYNTTHSCDDGGCTTSHVRQVKLYRVLQNWDEGSETGSPVDAPGEHGATGDDRFSYYPGEGTNLPWHARGMQAGTDYAAAEAASADITDQGWYQWDITPLVRAWVRGDQANFGLVLRDATGWEEHNTDWRSFCSSQYQADPSRRPKLVVRYNPDVPFADAGSDQEDLHWDGGAIVLDGTSSHDRPGGNNASLQYQWRILSPAYGSGLSGIIGTSATLSFTPDRPGEWEFQLTVTNDLQETATDTVHVRLLAIPAGHPRIYLTPSRLAALRSRATAGNSRWQQLKNEADSESTAMLAKALVGQVLDEASYCTAALARAQALVDGDDDCSSCPGDIALVYDWCHGQMDASQRAGFIDYFNHRGDNPGGENIPGWGNYWPRYGYSYGLMGLATLDENSRATEWLDRYRYQYNDLDLLDRIAPGGGWPEGMIYDWIANCSRVKAVAAWESATGEQLFLGSDWFRERIGYLLLHHWPGTAQEWGRQYHPYLSTGDTERGRGSMANYGRIMALILLERFPDHPLAPQLQDYLRTEPDGHSDGFLAHDEFLWFDPAFPAKPPTLTTHYAAGTGTLFIRSGWPTGAADTDTGATYLTFQAGDHFAYHQHWDQNSFTLFKHTDLALDSGVYSGDGLSYHDRNYYVRTIAHNTLIVYNPNEDFSHSRPDATSNDGGQRSVYPASRSPQSTEYFDRHIIQYDTADMLRFQDDPLYTYALGDATKAYNNPDYNQAMDGLPGNTAKLSRFQRELVYLRPIDGDSSKRDYLVLFDRVGVTSSDYSGQNTKLLFHTAGEPEINGSATDISPGEVLYRSADLVTAVNGNGRLFIRSLLPETVNMRKVGGRGEKSFWVFDANYDYHWSSTESQPRPVNDYESEPYGEWRVELEPADQELAHNFLTVLHPTTAAVTTMPSTTVIRTEGMRGVHIQDGELDRVVLFSSAADGSPPAGTIRYSYTPTADTLNLLVDLQPGSRYDLFTLYNGPRVTVTLVPAAAGSRQASDQGVLDLLLPRQGDSFVTYSLDNNRVYRLAVLPNATPEDISQQLDSLSAGSEDHGLNISPDGSWLVLETDRFDPACAGWPCLAVVAADLSRGEAVKIDGQVVHPDGSISAVSSDGNLVVYATTDGPHGRDLYASSRSGSAWSAPVLLTAASPYQYHSQPAISADGGRIVFDCDNDLADVGEAICEVNTDGSNFRVVFTPAQGPGPRYNPLHSPDYAPDGTIVFEADWDGEAIWRLSPGNPQPVKIGSFNNDNSPCVLPDGRVASLWMDRPGGPSVHELKVMTTEGRDHFMALTGTDIFDIGLGCGGSALLPGDLNRDGRIGLEDTILSLQVTTGRSPSDTPAPETEISGDGRIGLPEAVQPLRDLSGR